MLVSTDILQLRDKALSLINQAASEDELLRARLQLLGKKGKVAALLQGLGSFDPDQRRTHGVGSTR
jgi:hypothetical protein